MAGDVRNPRFLLPKLDKNKAECQPNFFSKLESIYVETTRFMPKFF